MKKLMIAAAAVAMIGAAQADNNPLVYNIKYTLKTLAPKTIVCKEGKCTICGTENNWAANYFELGSRKIEGLMASCTTCENTLDPEDVLFLLWDSTAKKAISGKILSSCKTIQQAFTYDSTMNPVHLANSLPRDYHEEVIQEYSVVTNWYLSQFSSLNASLCRGFVETNELIVATNGYYYGEWAVQLFGKKSNKAAVELYINYPCSQGMFQGTDAGGGPMWYTGWFELNAVAFGSWDVKKQCLKSASGNANGWVCLMNPAADDDGEPMDVDNSAIGGYLARFQSVCDAEFDYCDVQWDSTKVNYLLSDDGLGRPTNHVPAYGNITIKKNASAANKEVNKLVPSYMLYQ